MDLGAYELEEVNLQDAVKALLVIAGLSPEDISHIEDINGDGKKGVAEAINIIQRSSSI